MNTFPHIGAFWKYLHWFQKSTYKNCFNVQFNVVKACINNKCKPTFNIKIN